jgi:hypothetical protein
MASSVLVLMSLLSNHNLMSNMFDLDYLKAQEKNRLIKKEQRNHRASLAREYKALMFTSNTPHKHKHKHNLNNFQYYLNYNIKR